jgi:hypothetical protein
MVVCLERRGGKVQAAGPIARGKVIVCVMTENRL